MLFSYTSNPLYSILIQTPISKKTSYSIGKPHVFVFLMLRFCGYWPLQPIGNHWTPITNTWLPGSSQVSQLFGPVPADESTLGGGIQWVMAIENNALSQSSSYIGGCDPEAGSGLLRLLVFVDGVRCCFGRLYCSGRLTRESQ